MRERFRCVDCRLIFEGRRNTRGEVMPDDRAGSDPNAPILEATCMTCSSTGVSRVEIGDDTADRIVARIEDSGRIQRPPIPVRRPA